MQKHVWEAKLERVKKRIDYLEKLKRQLSREIYQDALAKARVHGYQMPKVAMAGKFNLSSYRNAYYSGKLSLKRAVAFYRKVEDGCHALDLIVELNKGRVPTINELRTGDVKWKTRTRRKSEDLA